MTVTSHKLTAFQFKFRLFIIVLYVDSRSRKKLTPPFAHRFCWQSSLFFAAKENRVVNVKRQRKHIEKEVVFLRTLQSWIAVPFAEQNEPCLLLLPSRSVMGLMHCAFAVSAITTVCCVSLISLLKSTFRSECILASSAPSGSIVRPVITSCLVATVLMFLVNAAILCKLAAKLGAHAASIFSKWQPLYFIAVSCERLIMRFIVISNYANNMGSGRANDCALSIDYTNQIQSTATLWNCAVLLTGVMTMCCDLDSELAPTLRRCAYSLLALCLLIDAVGSYVWGNVSSEVEVYSSHNSRPVPSDYCCRCLLVALPSSWTIR